MIAIFITRDLMFQSKVAAMAQRSGCQLAIAASLPAAQARCPDPALVEKVILDLSFDGLDLSSTVEEVRQAMPGARIIAYGPHVHVDRLNLARQSGCDLVQTRGQFESNLSSLFLDAST